MIDMTDAERVANYRQELEWTRRQLGGRPGEARSETVLRVVKELEDARRRAETTSAGAP